jgi:signal transduction histidine kinase
MLGHGSLSTRHLVVTLLVVVLVNAQLTWWIVFVLGQNRARLELERERLVASCRSEVERVTAALASARAALAIAALGHEEPAQRDPPQPFESWGWIEGEPCPAGWAGDAATPVLRLATPGGCVEAILDPGWWRALREVGPELEVLAAAPGGRDRPPSVTLPPPLASQAVAPRPEAWRGILSEYRGRIVMMVSEGAFFAILLFVLVALLIRTLRREVELERRHRNFLSAITHELRSPLSSVRLALQTVLGGRADAAAGKRFLDNALADTERLEDLVQKVLDVARYDRGTGRLPVRPVSLTELVREAVAVFERRATSHRAQVATDLADDVQVRVNEEAFAIVVSNLLDNAAKYGGAEPRIEVRLVEQDGSAVLDIRDHGAGIPDDVLPHIFDRFYRGGDEMTRTTTGTGLGLYLVRQITAAHRGTVAVKSTGPTGTTFRVTLPGARLQEQRP